MTDRIGRRLRYLAFVASLLLPTTGAAQITPLSVPDLPPAIPLFPLPNVAVLPYLQLPLHVFEPRYRTMLADAMAGDKVIGIVQIQPGFEGDYEGRPPIFKVGYAAVVVRVEPQPNGESDIILRAFIKFRITSEIAGKPYRIAKVDPVLEVVDQSVRAELMTERPSLENALAASLGVEPSSLRLPSLSDEDLVNTMVMNLDFDTVDRQLLIEQPGVLARARKLIELLRRPDPLSPPR